MLKNTENCWLLAVKAQNCGFLQRFPEQLFNVCVQEIVVDVWLETSKIQVFTTPALKLPTNLHNCLVLNLNSKPKFKDSRYSPNPLTPKPASNFIETLCSVVVWCNGAHCFKQQPELVTRTRILASTHQIENYCQIVLSMTVSLILPKFPCNVSTCRSKFPFTVNPVMAGRL